MQFTSLFTILAVAMTVAAAPAPEVIEARTTPTCNNQQTLHCCATKDTGKISLSWIPILGPLLNVVVGVDVGNCAVNILGGACTGIQKCCQQNVNQVRSRLLKTTLGES